jgi:hypothetical protein
LISSAFSSITGSGSGSWTTILDFFGIFNKEQENNFSKFVLNLPEKSKN